MPIKIKLNYNKNLPHCSNNTIEELEEKINNLILEKSEYERKINLFNSEYFAKLGELIGEILRLRVRIYDENFDPEFQNASANYEEFEKSQLRQTQNMSFSLDEDEKVELKSAYRKASRLCHPDKLDTDKKNDGEAFFKSLSEAYRNQNLNLVKTILLKVEVKFKSLTPSIKNINNKLVLKQKNDTLNEQISTLSKEIESIKSSNVYQVIQSIKNMDEYFEDLKNELKSELEYLKLKQ
jgi:hypothetical protein